MCLSTTADPPPAASSSAVSSSQESPMNATQQSTVPSTPGTKQDRDQLVFGAAFPYANNSTTTSGNQKQQEKDYYKSAKLPP